MKTIIWEYHKAFSTSPVEIAMTQWKDEHTMVVQSAFGYDAHKCDGLAEYMAIKDGYCYPVYSKSLVIEESFFNEAYNVIVNSLAAIFSAEEASGFDGDGLTVIIRCEEGHQCKFYIWAPSYHKDDRYKTNDVYQVFLGVLEKAGLTDWYKERRCDGQNSGEN
jgi:hypothetical protein